MRLHRGQCTFKNYLTTFPGEFVPTILVLAPRLFGPCSPHHTAYSPFHATYQAFKNVPPFVVSWELLLTCLTCLMVLLVNSAQVHLGILVTDTEPPPHPHHHIFLGIAPGTALWLVASALVLSVESSLSTPPT